MFVVLRQRNFAFLWIGQIVSILGNWMLFVALPFYTYALTGSTFATGVMFIVETIPALCFGSVAGVFVDRWNRKYTMLATNLIQAGLLALLFLVRSQEFIWIIYLFAFVDATVSQFFVPAKTAVIPQIVEEQHLLAANSLNSTSQELTRLIGPFIGGLLFGLFGINSVAILDMISFLFAFLMIALMVVPALPATAEEKAAETGASAGAVKVWHELLDGLSLVKREQLVLAIFLVVGVAMIGEGIIEVVITGYVETVLHGNALLLGWLMSAQAVGGIAGSLLVVRVSKWLRPALFIPICGLIFGGLLIFLAFVHVVALILPGMTLAGAVAIGFFVPQVTLLQSNVDNEYQGRIFGVFGALQSIAMLLGMLLASGLSDRVGIVPMILVDSACNLLAALLSITLVMPALRAKTNASATSTGGNSAADGARLSQESLTA
jgi:MFS family permease